LRLELNQHIKEYYGFLRGKAYGNLTTTSRIRSKFYERIEEVPENG